MDVLRQPSTSPTLEGQSVNVEIVTHCWRYGRVLRYQLSSLVLHPPTALRVRYTLFYNPEDEVTLANVGWFGEHRVENVEWVWRELPRERLFRRAIGRNLACRDTRADWVWFTDADYVFGAGCLDALATHLTGDEGTLLFPGRTLRTTTNELGDRLIDEAGGPPRLLPIPRLEDFTSKRNSRAIGGIQIVRGATCRERGYCADVPRLQRPVSGTRFRRCRGDVVFRRRLGARGRAVDVPALHRIRHSRSGRYDPVVEN